jgi:pimeloyl-ACP methyl ester carboxylesterase
MSDFRRGSVRCIDPHGFHRMAWVEWGAPDNPRVLVCVHGLTRSGRDFDHLARALCGHYRVVCPDLAGRGESDWLNDPRDYHPEQYGSDIATLLARAGVESVDWVGTSLGGIVGMLLAARPGTPIGRLVLNDVGCAIPKTALERMRSYVGKPVAFATLDALEAAMQSVSPFGALTPAQWRHLATHVSRQDSDGQWRFRYDPGIAANFNAAPEAGIDLRAVWAAVKAPALVLRGEHSDVLPPEIYDETLARPGTQGRVIPGCGHVPALLDEAQIAFVRDFLLA